MAGLSIRNRGRSLVIQEGLGAEPLLLQIIVSQLKWFERLIWIPLGHLLDKLFKDVLQGEDPGLTGEMMSLA